MKIDDFLPNVKEWPNTATRMLRDLIDKHNKLVDEVNELKQKLNQPK